MRETTYEESSTLDQLIARQRMLLEQVRIHVDALVPGTLTATKASETLSHMRNDLSKPKGLRDTLRHQPYLVFGTDNRRRVH